MDFETLWRAMTDSLNEPGLFEVPGTGERFHAWYDRGGDGKPESIWTKPLQGDKQVRLPQRKEHYRRVFDAGATLGAADAASYQDVTLRGHYLYTVMRHHGWDPGA